MHCPSCAHDLRAGARFCDACGHPVGGVAAPGRRPAAPAHLAEKILASRGRVEGERKQVTVLFADVKGSMELAERVDPEAWHRILDRFFAILADGVHRFEGTVNQFTGDGIMALFGAPLAHEDHARRACAAALRLGAEIRRYARDLRLAEGLNFSVRMGINSGDVVVGTIGDDLHMDYTALGATVGLAQRMEQLAEPGKVYLTEHTARLVEGFFRLEELGAFSVKGLRERVRVYELEGPGPLRTRLDLSRARGLSRFVGREKETAVLEAALARAVEGRGGVVSIVANAGVGKSRLCHELIERTRARGLAVHQAHCIPHGRMVPFLPIFQLLRGYFGISEEDGNEAARRKIAGTVLLLDPELTGSLPLLFDFLAVTDPERPAPRMDPEARQRRLATLLTRLVQARSRREPSVLLVEDLHWIDGASEVFLEQLAAALPGTATLLLVTFRPEYRAGWSGASSQQLTLEPLGGEAIGALLQDLLGSDPSLAGIGDLVRERTAGNPFFIEEVVQALVEGGSLVGTKGAYRLVKPVADLVVPPTVQAVLAARIDRLPERAKEVLQTAAVIGMEFAEAVLRRVSEVQEAEVSAALATLTRAELVYERTGHPEDEYGFKHPLTHEVAYRSQLGERRAPMHAAVARAIAELYADKLDERAALLAHHWEEAGERLEAARWSRRAAEWAGVSDLAEAMRQWRKVRALLALVPDSPEKSEIGVRAGIALLGLGWRVGIPEDEASAVFAEGLTVARQTNDPDILASLLNTYGTVRGMSGHVAEALERTREATRLADETDDVGLQLAARVPLVEAQYMAGDLRAALETLREAAACAARVPDGAGILRTGFGPSNWVVMMTGWLLFETGHPEEAGRELERALVLAREHGETELLGFANELSSYVAAFVGDPGRALDHARQAFEIAERIGSTFSRTSAYDALGSVHLANRDWAAAASAFEQALAIVRERGIGLHWEPRILAELAEAQLGAGAVDNARTMAEDAVRRARQLSTKVTECRALLTFARTLVRSEGAAAREPVAVALAQALALVQETGAGLYEPGIRLELAELARLTGDDETHRRERSRARRLLDAMGATRAVASA